MAVATTMAIIGAVAAVSAAGASVHASRESRRQTRDASRDQENAMRAQNAAAERETGEKDAQAKATQQARMARARQSALARGGYSGTIATSPLGLSGQAGAAKTKLGE